MPVTIPPQAHSCIVEMTMNSTTFAHQAVQRSPAWSCAVVLVAALMVFPATGRADVCHDFWAALDIEDTTFRALRQHGKQQRTANSEREAYSESLIETFLAASDAVDRTARTVREAVNGEAAATIDALLAIMEAQDVALRTSFACKKTLPESKQRSLYRVLEAVAEVGDAANRAYRESLKAVCQN